MKIFIDVDNTILEHSNFYSKSTENRTHTLISKNIEVNKEAVINMYKTAITSSADTIRNLWEQDNVYILTKYPNLEFDVIKQKRLAEILNITHDELITATDNKGISKYLNVKLEDNKMDYIKRVFQTDNVSNFILIDDYSTNILQWEAQGGIGIKFFNEYNSPNHPSVGIAIRDFKILQMLIDNKAFKKIFIQYDNPLMTDILIHSLITNKNLKQPLHFNSDNNIIDLADLVHKDSYKQMGLEEIKTPIKYNYLNFIHEYYNLREEINSKYWIEKLSPFYSNDEFMIFKSPIDIDVDYLFSQPLASSSDFLSIKILTENNSTHRNYDLFITLNEEKNYIDSHIYKEKINTLFNLFLAHSN